MKGFRRMATTLFITSLISIGGCTNAVKGQHDAGKQPSGSSSSRAFWPSPDPGAALLVGWGGTLKEVLSSAIAVPLGARITSLHVNRANGQRVSTKHNVTRLLAGDYQLEISCSVRIEGMESQTYPTIKAVVSSGHVYAFSARAGFDSCSPLLEDVTSQI